MKGKLLGLGALALSMMATPSLADTLTTGTGDGQVVLNVDGFGTIGSNGAFYNPLGTGTSASTIFLSTLSYRIGASGARTEVNAGTLVSFGGTDTSRVSVFTLPQLSVALTQTVASLFDSNGVQTGSQLTQSYAFTNLGSSAISLDLARYIDGDLLFDGSLTDGGGRLTSNGAPLLFEIDSATGASTASTFLGLYNTGGTQNGYRIGQYSVLRTAILNGDAFDNTITNDTNPVDGFIDAGAGYDVALGLGSLLNIGAGATSTLNTVTLFGSGAPGSVVTPVPEPVTWAMLMIGFGAIGGVLRRLVRRSEQRFTDKVRRIAAGLE
jgi:hypothetical protein